MIVAPSAAAAAPMSISAPVDHAELVPHTTLNIGYSAECPADKACGSWQDYNVFNNIQFDLKHATIEDQSDVLGDTWSQIPLPSTSTSLLLDDMLTAGPWKLTSEWFECPRTPNQFDRLEYGACTHQAVVRNLHVRPQVGTKDSPPNPQVWADRSKPSVANTNLYFMCNAPAPAYRIAYSVQKFVKVKGKYRWVDYGRTLKNVRAIPDVSARNRCVVKRTHMMPLSLKTTKLRVQFTVASVGYAPAARPRLVTTRTYTRASAQVDGGVVIRSAARRGAARAHLCDRATCPARPNRECGSDEHVART